MKNKVIFIVMIFLFPFCTLCRQNSETDNKSVYTVSRLPESMEIDANWEKPQWKNIPILGITNYMGEIPQFKPLVKAKMMYDDNNVYVIFHVQDQFVRCIESEINGNVWEDACVEFFFSPDTQSPEKYFNLEVTAGGTPLMHHNVIPRREYALLDTTDIQKIEIAHTLPKIVDPEIKEPVTWTLEYRIPLDILKKFSKITPPSQGVIWKANFYKIADKTSNPHYITWSPVVSPAPDFHLPQFFGTLIFE